ncbi:MAG: hypothetical protein Q4P15_05725 [Propionibacteriaceae bacterium]|nr:hypothetical protein [Propionibacteriaceae bacterium]
MADEYRGSDLLMLMLRRWWVISLSIALGIGISILALLVTPSTFTATATQLVKGIPGEGAGANYQAAQFAESRARSYPTFIASTTVREGVRADLGPEFTDIRLSETLSASNPDGTPLVKVKATGKSAEEARDLANSAARHLARFITDIETVEGTSPVVVEIAVQAGLPAYSSFPSKSVFLALGASMGAALGIVAVLAKGAMANRRGQLPPDGIRAAAPADENASGGEVSRRAEPRRSEAPARHVRGTALQRHDGTPVPSDSNMNS